MTNSSGLVLDLDFAEKSGTVAGDSSRYGNDGAFNGCKWVEHGLEFNGTSGYVNCGNDASLDILTHGTISCWFNAASWSGVGGIISKRDLWGANMDWSLYHSGAQIFFRDGSNYRFGALALDLSTGTQQHIAIVKNGTTGTLYLDGVSIGTDDIDATLKTGDTVRIGVMGGDASLDIFDGTIDQVRIHNRALNASEIKTYYDSTKHRYK